MNHNEQLFLGAEINYLDIIQDALDNGADINYQNQIGDTALIKAAENGYFDIVKFLVENGETNNKDFVLWSANLHGYFDIVKFLVGKGGQKCKDLMLQTATIEGCFDKVKFLVENGADINYQNQIGDTALMIAAEKNYYKIFYFLLLYNANFYHKNQNGNTILTNSQTPSKINQIFNKFLYNKNKIMMNKGDFYKLIINFLKNNHLINYSLSQKQELIINSLKLLKYQIIKFSNDDLNIAKFWQKEIINSLKFDELNYSLLHIAVLNDWLQVENYLIKEWPIKINYEDNSGNSAWNHACMLLKSQSAFAIKHYDQLSAKDKIFLEEIQISTLNNYAEESQKHNKMSSKIRKSIFDYYIWDKAVDAFEYFKDEANLIGATSKSQNSSSKSQKMKIF